MSETHRPTDLWEQARKDVAAHAPPPKYPPLYAAVCVAFGASLVCVTFAAIFGINVDGPKGGQALTITSLLAALVTYFPLRSMEKQHDRAASERYRELVEGAKEQKH